MDEDFYGRLVSIISLVPDTTCQEVKGIYVGRSWLANAGSKTWHVNVVGFWCFCVGGMAIRVQTWKRGYPPILQPRQQKNWENAVWAW